jgi:hypothetical protein
MTMVSLGEEGLAGEEGVYLNWFSTHEFLKSRDLCKEKKRTTVGLSVVPESVVHPERRLCREEPALSEVERTYAFRGRHTRGRRDA